MRQAFAGMLWSKQLYDYDVARWLDGDPTQPPPPAARADRPQQPLAQLRRLRHHVDAGQVGVPVVRGVGPGLPLRRAGPRRPGVRQVPADPALPRVVPAPERRAARLRVGLRRRQPAGAGVGGARGVRHRRRPRRRLPRAGSSTSCWSTSPGGSTARTPTAPTCSRAASSASTTSARSTAPTCPSAARSSSPTPRRGWRSTRCTWRRSPSVLRRHGQPTQRPGAQVPRALRPDPPRAGRPGPVGRGRRLLLRPAAAGRRHLVPVKVRSMVGVLPVLASVVVDEVAHPPGRGARQAVRHAARRTGLSSRKPGRAGPGPRASPATAACCSAWSASTRSTALFEQLFDEEEFLSPYGLRARLAVHRDHPYVLDVGRPARARIDYEPAESTTDMFGGNSNWRGPIWFPLNYLLVSSLERYGHFFGDDVDGRVPDRVGPAGARSTRSPRTCARRLISLFLRRRRRPAARASAGSTSCSTTRAGRTTCCSTSTSTATTAPGSGASHQTGWTGLVADLIRRRPGSGRRRALGDLLQPSRPRPPDRPRTRSMTMTDHYDVIIIGSGAGGGTLAHTLADVRQADPASSSGATTCRGRWTTGTRSRCSSTASTSRREPGTTPTASRSSPRSTTSSAAPPSSTAPRCTGCARRTSASSTTSTGLAGLAAHLRRLRAVVHRGRVALPGARQRRRGPDRGPPLAALPVAGGVARAAHPAALRRPAGGRLPPVPRAVRHPARRGRPGRRAPASAARGATATRAWCTPSPTPRPSPCGPLLDRPNVTLLVDAEVVEARDRRRAAARSPASWCPAAATTETYRRRHRRGLGRGRPTRPSCCSHSANDQHPNGLANGSDQVGRNYMFHNSKAVVALSEEPNDTRVPEDARASTTSTSAPRTTTSRSATSRWSASPTPRR